MGFGRACAPVRCAHPSFWVHRHAKRNAMCPPPIAASLLLIRSLKIDKKNYRTRAAHVMGFPEIICFPSGSSLGRPRHGIFSFHWTVILFLFFSSYLFLFFSFYSSSSYSSLLLVSVNFCDFLTPTRRCDRKSTKIFGR